MPTYYILQGDMKMRKPYTCFNFGIDLFMTIITGGLWLIWIFVREMRNR